MDRTNINLHMLTFCLNMLINILLLINVLLFLNLEVQEMWQDTIIGNLRKIISPTSARPYELSVCWYFINLAMDESSLWYCLYSSIHSFVPPKVLPHSFRLSSSAWLTSENVRFWTVILLSRLRFITFSCLEHCVSCRLPLVHTICVLSWTVQVPNSMTHEENCHVSSIKSTRWILKGKIHIDYNLIINIKAHRV